MNDVSASRTFTGEKPNFRRMLELAIVLVLLLVRYGRDRDDVKFHVDESHYIETSVAFETYFSGDFASPLWDESYTTRTQPPMVRYIVGLGRKLGGFGPKDLNTTWDFNQTAEVNERRGAKPSDELLWWSRLPMVALGVGCAFAMFIFAWQIGGRPAAYVWLVLILLNNFMVYHLRLAMGESPLLTGIVVAMIFSYLGTRAAVLSQPKFYWPAPAFLALAGAAAGFAGASKLNGLAAMGPAMLLTAGLAFKLGRPAGLRWPFALLGVGLIGMATVGFFVAVNPFLWPDAIGRVHMMWEERTNAMRIFIGFSPESEIRSIGDRVIIVSKAIFQEAASLRWRFTFLPNLLLTFLGMGLLAKGTYQWLTRREADAAPAVVLLMAVVAAGPSLMSPLNWGRYFLLPAYFSTFFIAIAIAWCGRTALAWRAARKGDHPQVSSAGTSAGTVETMAK